MKLNNIINLGKIKKILFLDIKTIHNQFTNRTIFSFWIELRW